jgi:hypothetical protein
MWSGPIKASPVATVRHEPPFPACLPYPLCPARSILSAGSASSMAWHLERKVDRNGMLSIDLKRYYVSAKLVGQYVSVQLDAKARCVYVYLEQQRLKSLQERTYRLSVLISSNSRARNAIRAKIAGKGLFFASKPGMLAKKESLRLTTEDLKYEQRRGHDVSGSLFSHRGRQWSKVAIMGGLDIVLGEVDR